ncbi:MAG: glycosyl hydrolase [Bacteroidetes bacterium]|nr:glycosyl hydrolase [Bacteroidota bacterium]
MIYQITSFITMYAITISTYAQTEQAQLNNPNATPEAVALYKYINSISGKQILSGQHCAPLVGSNNLAVIHRSTGQYPAVFGQDFGFSYPGYWDGINFRQRIVDEAIKRNEEGFIITLMWHAVRPTEDEPVTFSESVQGDLTDEEWNELMTPGSNLHERWKSQVDVIAWFLKQLQYANVPVLWRPYHEMNGDWFWWGKKGGDNGYKKLFRMMHERLVGFHGLNNLIWVYNTNEFKNGVDTHETYYPGDDIVDIIATDVYSEGFNQVNYDQMMALAGNKPMALGEVGAAPSVEILKAQPKWAWFMSWGAGGDGRGGSIRDTYGSDLVLKHKDLPWTDIEKYRVHYPVLK